MIDTLAIKWEDSSRVKPSVANGIKKIVAKRLGKFGYRGIWRVTPVQKRREASCDHDGFKYKRLEEAGTPPYIRAFCRPKDPESCWEVAIYPPADYDIVDIDINLSGNKPKPKPKPKKPEKAQPHKIAVGQVLKVDITGKTKFGLLVCVPSVGLKGLVPIEYLGKEYDADNLNAHRIGQSLKVQVTELEPNVKFSPESAKHVTETDSVDDIFNGSADSDGMLRLKGYSASIERVRQLLLWLENLARDYYPDPILRKQAIDEIELELLVKYSSATQAQRKTVATLLRALKHKGWIYITGGRDIGITEDGWIELGGEPQRGGDAPPITTITEIEEPEGLEEVLQDIVEESEVEPVPSVYMEIPKDPLSYDEEPESDLSVWTFIEKTAKLHALRQEVCEIEQWMDINTSGIAKMAEMIKSKQQ